LWLIFERYDDVLIVKPSKKKAAKMKKVTLKKKRLNIKVKMKIVEGLGLIQRYMR